MYSFKCKLKVHKEEEQTNCLIKEKSNLQSTHESQHLPDQHMTHNEELDKVF